MAAASSSATTVPKDFFRDPAQLFPYLRDGKPYCSILIFAHGYYNGSIIENALTDTSCLIQTGGLNSVGCVFLFRMFDYFKTYFLNPNLLFSFWNLLGFEGSRSPYFYKDLHYSTGGEKFPDKTLSFKESEGSNEKEYRMGVYVHVSKYMSPGDFMYVDELNTLFYGTGITTSSLLVHINNWLDKIDNHDSKIPRIFLLGSCANIGKINSTESILKVAGIDTHHTYPGFNVKTVSPDTFNFKKPPTPTTNDPKLSLYMLNNSLNTRRDTRTAMRGGITWDPSEFHLKREKNRLFNSDNHENTTITKIARMDHINWLFNTGIKDLENAKNYFEMKKFDEGSKLLTDAHDKLKTISSYREEIRESPENSKNLDHIDSKLNKFIVLLSETMTARDKSIPKTGGGSAAKGKRRTRKRNTCKLRRRRTYKK